MASKTEEREEHKTHQPEKTEEPKTDAKANGDKPAKPEGLDVAFLTDGGMILAEALASETQPIRARNDRQQVMDAKVNQLHKLWLSKGKPSDWNSMVRAKVVATYFPEPDKSTEFKKYVNRAVLLHGVRVRWGSSFVVTLQHIEKFNLDKSLLGHEAISFAILDKRETKKADEKKSDEKKSEPETAKA